MIVMNFKHFHRCLVKIFGTLLKVEGRHFNGNMTIIFVCCVKSEYV